MPHLSAAKNQNPYAVLAKLPQNYGMDHPLNGGPKSKAAAKKEHHVAKPEPKADWVDIKRPPAHKKEAENGKSWLQRLLPSFLTR